MELRLIFNAAIFSLVSMASFSCIEQKKQKKNMNDELADAQVITEGLDTATFGTGCFWCTEAIFQRLKGVTKVTSGYSGGTIGNPTYEEVCKGTSGYAEVCQVVYDPATISYDELLKVFWKVHDPTTLNRQGNDVGPQYRSVIFYHSDDQKEKAEHYKEELNKIEAYNSPVVTAVEPYSNFYAAEDYHQNYYNENGGQAYCHFVIQPKIKKFEEVFRDKLKTF
ncbi:peptide-methionine (S)-S-oxide reductase MsrA [Rhizosphaericola mali]|nr:peptide-methionine (S)-S-oxide reductase MsrA [Rhizosphaericola mali]